MPRAVRRQGPDARLRGGDPDQRDRPFRRHLRRPAGAGQTVRRVARSGQSGMRENACYTTELVGPMGNSMPKLGALVAFAWAWLFALATRGRAGWMRKDTRAMWGATNGYA